MLVRLDRLKSKAANCLRENQKYTAQFLKGNVTLRVGASLKSGKSGDKS